MIKELLFKLAQKDVNIATLLAISIKFGHIDIVDGKELLEAYCILKHWLEKSDISANNPINLLVTELEELSEEQVCVLKEHYAEWKSSSEITLSDDVCDVSDQISPADIDEAFLYNCMFYNKQDKVC